MTKKSARVQSLHVYPVKSLKVCDLQSMQMTLVGPEHDREWIITDEKNRFITQRTFPKMVTIETKIENGSLGLSVDGKSPIFVSMENRDGDAYEEVTVFNSRVQGLYQGNKVSSWLSDFFGMPVKLFRYGTKSKRLVDSKYASDTGAETRFTDSRPILITSQASLDALNAELDSPVPMNRFRANIVLEGCDAWQEDAFQSLHIGEVKLVNAQGCSRCKVTTVDQAEGIIKGVEPLNTLSRIRKKDGKVYFGCYYIPVSEGIISVDDEVHYI